MAEQNPTTNPAESALQALAKKSLQAERRKKRLLKLGGGLLLVVLLIFGALKFLEMRQRLARLESRITFIKGEVVLREPGGKERKGALGDLVPEGTVVRTPAGSVADIGFMGGGGVKLDSDTEVKMQLLYHKKKVRQIEIQLDKGRLFNKVPEQEGDSRFGISSPSCQTWVRGTGFFVEVGQLETLVATRDGKVEVLPAAGGAAAMVGAQQKVKVSGAAAGAVEAVAQRERKLFAQLDRIHELDSDGNIADLVGITNSLGMPLVPLLIEGGATDGEVVMFGAHPVRSRDFAAFIADPDRAYEMKPTGPDD
ncbi:MAG: FecR family protein, partial [Verrucomicrobiales bacterium]